MSFQIKPTHETNSTYRVDNLSSKYNSVSLEKVLDNNTTQSVNSVQMSTGNTPRYDVRNKSAGIAMRQSDTSLEDYY